MRPNHHGTPPQVQEYLMQLMIKLEKDKDELQIDGANAEHDKVRLPTTQPCSSRQSSFNTFMSAGAGSQKCTDNLQEGR